MTVTASPSPSSIGCVYRQRQDRELGQALAPARLAVELGEHHAQPRIPRRRAAADRRPDAHAAFGKPTKHAANRPATGTPRSPFGPQTAVNPRKLPAHGSATLRTNGASLQVFCLGTPPRVLLAMQKVVGSNPISRSRKGSHLRLCLVSAVRCRDRPKSYWLSSRSATRSKVPSPGGLVIQIVPPRASTRSARPVRPDPREGSAPPTPSSPILSSSRPSSARA